MKKTTKNHSGLDDGPEEGEIVSDDLEDISDESMICTPSIDFDESPREKRRKRRKSYSQRRDKRRKRSRRKSLNSDSSDKDTIVDGRLKFQLKAAVHVGLEEDHKNKSLRTRLRGMVKSSSGPESETVEIEGQKSKQVVANSDNKASSPVAIIDLVEQDTSSCIEILGSASNSAPENDDSAAEQTKGEDIDSELIQLRIEALKTAINNKFANRRKRKKDGEGVASSDDTNKENTSNNSEENQEKKSPANENKHVETPQVSPSINNDSDILPSPEEDEDVLRAILLASISKKITKTTSESPDLVVNEAQTKMTVLNQNRVLLHKMKTNNFKLNNTVKRVLNKGIVNKASGTIIKMPQVKPLIINLNSDSDSDLEFSSGPEKSPKKPNNDIGNAIENTVEKFLKEQRAKVESAAPVNGASATVFNQTKSSNLSNNPPISKTANKPQLAVKIIASKDKSKPQKTPELEKSALKFLPESKREEYRKLQNLLKLKKAQMKKPKSKKISLKMNEINSNSKLSANKKTNDEISSQALPVTVNNIKKPLQNPTVNKKIDQIKNSVVYKKTNNLKNIATKPKQPSRNIPLEKITVHKSSQTTEAANHVQLSSATEARIQDFRRQEQMAAKREQERKEESVVLRAILKQLQTIKDGRLQIHDRYKSLRPLVKKLNEASKEQKQCEQEIEKLMRQLAEARAKQEVLHKNMLKSVKELADEKKKIDNSLPKTNTLIITSTPIKPGGVTPSSSFATISSDQSAIEDKAAKDESDGMLNTWEQSTICNNPVGIADPPSSVINTTKDQVAEMDNDSAKHRKPQEKVRYVSPLDVGQRQGTIDPFGIVCPFEVNGRCKDPECSFNHLPVK